MGELHLPWLELSIVCPLVAAALCGCLRETRTAQRTALVASQLAVAFTVGEWLDFGTLGSFSAQDKSSLVREMLGRELFVIDELSAPLLPMTAILFTLIIATTMRSKAERFSFALAMLAESTMLATLSCTAPSALILLLAASAFLLWYELRRRGSPSRFFAIYMLAHVVLLAIGTGLIVWGGDSVTAQNVAAIALVASSLIRAGVFPLHSWIVDVFERAPLGTAVLYVAPMTGAYLVMREVLPVVPVWALHSVAVLSLFTAVYSAGMALVQVEARRFFAFLFLSHSSLVLVGLQMANPIGMTGGLCIWLASGFSLGGFAIAIRSVESRIGRITLAEYHGLFDHMPYLGSLFLISGLASIGFPGGLAFIGMELLVEGTIEVYPLIGTSMVLAAALNGVSILRAYFRIFTGTRHVATISLASRPTERFAVITVALLIFATGLWPSIAVRSRYHAADALLDKRQASGVDALMDDEQSHGASAFDDLLQLGPESETLPSTDEAEH